MSGLLYVVLHVVYRDDVEKVKAKVASHLHRMTKAKNDDHYLKKVCNISKA